MCSSSTKSLEVDRRAPLRARPLDLLVLEQGEAAGLHLVAAHQLLVAEAGAIWIGVPSSPGGAFRPRRERLGRGRTSMRWRGCFGRTSAGIGHIARVDLVGHPPIADTPPFPIEQVEPHVLRPRRRIQRHRDRHQSERQRAGPDRSRHGPTLPSARAPRERAGTDVCGAAMRGIAGPKDVRGHEGARDRAASPRGGDRTWRAGWRNAW